MILKYRLYGILDPYRMFRLFLVLAIVAVWFLLVQHSAYAQAAVPAPDPTAVSLKPLQTIFEGLVPYIILGLGGIITALFGYITKILADKWKIQINAQLVANVKSAMLTQAGSMLAASADNLSSKTFHVGSAEIANGVNAVIPRIADTLKKLGPQANDDALQTILTGEIGKLQAGVVSPPAVSVSADKVTVDTTSSDVMQK